MRISDWSSDVCSSDLDRFVERRAVIERAVEDRLAVFELADLKIGRIRLTFDSVARVIDHVEAQRLATDPAAQQHGRAKGYAFIGMEAARHLRSEEHTSELQSLMRITYAVCCLKKK